MRTLLNRREFLALGAAAAAFPRLLLGEPSLTVMDTWFGQETELDIPAQAALLKKLGYGGMALTWGQKHAERLKALREEKLEVPGLFVVSDLDGDLRGPADFLKGTEIPIWLALTLKKKLSEEDAAKALTALLETSKGVPIALVQPAGSPALAERTQVGIVFTQEPGADPRKALESVLPRLKAVLLQEGFQDTLPILRALSELKYAGPFCLQGPGVRGRLAERLEASMKTWTELKQQARGTSAHVFISGVVQGVSYRASTQEQARRLGVTGWVRNLQDGRVEARMQGPPGKIDELIRWCHQGPSAAKVDKVVVTWEKAGEEFKTFEVRS